MTSELAGAGPGPGCTYRHRVSFGAVAGPGNQHGRRRAQPAGSCWSGPRRTLTGPARPAAPIQPVAAWAAVAAATWRRDSTVPFPLLLIMDSDHSVTNRYMVSVASGQLKN